MAASDTPSVRDDYRSGEDIELAFAGLRQSFATDDFDDRVLVAARRLGLVRGRVGVRTRADLVAIALDGPTASASGAIGQAILAHPSSETIVYWLRKLVFRRAWLDHRLAADAIAVRVDERRREYRYEVEGRPLPVAGDNDVPRFTLDR